VKTNFLQAPISPAIRSWHLPRSPKETSFAISVRTKPLGMSVKTANPRQVTPARRIIQDGQLRLIQSWAVPCNAPARSTVSLHTKPAHLTQKLTVSLTSGSKASCGKRAYCASYADSCSCLCFASECSVRVSIRHNRAELRDSKVKFPRCDVTECIASRPMSDPTQRRDRREPIPSE